MRSEAAQSEVNWHTAKAENGDLASALKPAQNIYGDVRRWWGVQSLKNILVMKVKIISKRKPRAEGLPAERKGKKGKDRKWTQDTGGRRTSDRRAHTIRSLLYTHIYMHSIYVCTVIIKICTGIGALNHIPGWKS